MSNYLPIYFKQALKMDLKAIGTKKKLNSAKKIFMISGILSTAPFFAKMVGKFLSSFSSDYIMRKELLRHGHVSKLNSTIGSFRG